MDFKFNVNNYVKVKLTERGKEILRDRHEELDHHIKSRGGKGVGTFILRLDEEGYYKTQLWMLMETFGEHISIASEPPFETDIILLSGEEVTI